MHSSEMNQHSELVRMHVMHNFNQEFNKQEAVLLV